MRDALAVLHRIRNHRKKGAEKEFMNAERARLAQEARVDEISQSVARSREADRGQDEAGWVAQAQAWRLKMELALRRERGRLSEVTQEVNKRQDRLASATRQARVVEKVIERIDDRTSDEARRREVRRLDDLGTSRWRRGEG
jgi:flagellar biosynthesis chaperone FliJ